MLQLLMYIFPLFTFPYLFRVLGSSSFGYISLIVTFFSYFYRIIDYSFNIYSVRDVSVEPPKSNSEIFYKVLSLRLILFLLSIVVIIPLYLFFAYEKIEVSTLLYSFGSLFAFAITPYWFFKGKQEMKYLLIFNVLNKAITLLLLILFLKNEKDYLSYFIYDFIGNILVAVFTLYYALKKYKINYIVLSFNTLYSYLNKGLSLFVSDFITFVYSSSNILILGFFVDNSLLGYYAISEKVLNTLKGMFSPFVQAAFPAIASITKKSSVQAINYIKKSSFYIGSLGLIMSVIVFILSPYIIYLIIGYYNDTAILCLKMLSPIIFSFSITSVFSNLFLHSFGFFKTWNTLILITFVLTLTFIIIAFVINQNYLFNVIYTSLFSEIFIAISSVILFVKYKSKQVSYE